MVIDNKPTSGSDAYPLPDWTHGTVSQAAAYLGVRDSTIRKWILLKRIPYLKLGRCVRISAEALARFACENTVPARENGREHGWR